MAVFAGFRPYRHAYLLASLLLVIAVRPFLAERMVGVKLLDAFMLVSLIIGAVASARSRGALLVTGALTMATVIARIYWDSGEQPALLYVWLSGYAAVYAIVAALVASSLFQHSDRISADTLCGALSIYLMIGMLWTMLYAMLEAFAPGSFQFQSAPPGDDQSFERLLGFSFTTLTTLGYGNVSPATPRADSLATLEAIAGQVYLAVVIARLVAMQLAQDMNIREGDKPSSKKD